MANDQPGDIAATIRERARAGMLEFSEHPTEQTIVRAFKSRKSARAWPRARSSRTTRMISAVRVV